MKKRQEENKRARPARRGPGGPPMRRVERTERTERRAKAVLRRRLKHSFAARVSHDWKAMTRRPRLEGDDWMAGALV